MTVLFLLLYLLAAVCFGLAAARVDRRVSFVALGLLFMVLVPFLQTLFKV